MTRIRSLTKIAISLMLAAAVLLTVVSPAFALGEIDQNNPLWGFSAYRYIEEGKAFGQTFIPARANIVGVDLSFDANVTVKESVTVSIRESSGIVPENFTGKLLNSVTREIEITQKGGDYGYIVHFDLPYRTLLEPGKTYVIEVTLAAGDGLLRLVAGMDHYPDGIMIIDEGSYVRELGYADWGFATYYGDPETKADILADRGVPGKGLSKAPGLQKEFTGNGQPAEKAGKK